MFYENFNLKEITETAKKELEITRLNETIGSTYNNEASQDEIKTIISGICKEKDTNPTTVLISIALLMQQGATSPKTPENKTTTINNVKIQVGDIRRQTKKLNNLTLRKLARGLKQEIIEIMLAMGEKAPDGNLAKVMKIELENVTKEESVWASDFQTYNDNCPKRVKNWLVNNYMEKFRK